MIISLAYDTTLWSIWVKEWDAIFTFSVPSHNTPYGVDIRAPPVVTGTARSGELPLVHDFAREADPGTRVEALDPTAFAERDRKIRGPERGGRGKF